MQTVILIRETLDDCVLAAVNDRERGEEETVIKVALKEESCAEVLGVGCDHERSGISDARGTDENGEAGVTRVALHEKAASADGKSGAIKGVAKISVAGGDIQIVKPEGVGNAKNKMAIGETCRSADGSFREKRGDIAAGTAEQRAAAGRELKNLSAGGGAEQ